MSETLLKNFLFLVYTIKENTHTCSSKHLILFCNAIFSEWRKSISINSDLFDIIGLLDEHYVKSGFMGVSNTVNLGAATDSDNNSGVVAGNISDEAMKLLMAQVHRHQFQLNLILSNMNKSLQGLEQLCFQVQ